MLYKLLGSFPVEKKIPVDNYYTVGKYECSTSNALK